MSNIVDLAAKRESLQPHLTGPIRCMHCTHEWVGVTPVGAYAELECPACGLHKGVRMGCIMLSPGKLRWVCNCGCDVFILADAAPVCIQCGTLSTWEPEP